MTTFLLGKNHFPCSWQLHAVCLQADIIGAMGVPIAYEDWTHKDWWMQRLSELRGRVANLGQVVYEPHARESNFFLVRMTTYKEVMEQNKHPDTPCHCCEQKDLLKTNRWPSIKSSLICYRATLWWALVWRCTSSSYSLRLFILLFHFFSIIFSFETS